MTNGKRARRGIAALAVSACLINVGSADAVSPPDVYGANTGGSDQAARADSFTARNVTLLGRTPVAAFSGTPGGANDVWGYVSPSGREYAIMGLQRGTGFVEVTDPRQPVVIATISDALSTWSDIAVYSQYAYNVNETSGGLQIIDLRGIDQGIVTSAGSLTQFGLSTAHNVYVNPDSGYAYVIGSNLASGGIVSVNLANPAAPQIDGFWNDTYVHDIQVVTYAPGTANEREIAFAFAGHDGLKIVDVTDKSNMVTLSTLAYPNVTYCHQGWLSDDRRLLNVDDELDELQDPQVTTTTTYVINVEDLIHPWPVRSFTNGLRAIDHNLMVRGDYVFEANYTSGLRIYHVADIANVHEVGYFDTYPLSDDTGFEGAWGVYTGLPSGVILVSDIDSGLFALMWDCNGNDQDDARELAMGLASDCNGNGTLDVCDIADAVSEDCNGNDRPDECDAEIRVGLSSGPLSPIGGDSPQSYTFSSPPLAADDVTVEFVAFANVFGVYEYIDVDWNGTPLGTVFDERLPERCPATFDREALVISASSFNDVALTGAVTFDMRPTVWVDADTCAPETFIVVNLSYLAVGSSLDCNRTGKPDECESGDIDGNLRVDLDDFAAYHDCLTTPCRGHRCDFPLYTDPCCGLADFDHDGDSDLEDFAALQRSATLD